MRTTTVTTMLCAFLWLAAANSADQEAESAKDREIEAILKARTASTKKVDKEALEKLATLKTVRTKKGDLEGALAAKKAIEEIEGKSSKEEGGGGTEAAKPADDSLEVLDGGGADGKTRQKKAKTAIEKAYLEFSRALLADNIDKAKEYVDPWIKDNAPPNMLNGMLTIWAGAAKVAQLGKDDIRVEEVTIGAKGNDARVVPAFRRGLRWEAEKPTYWVSRNGKWYLGDEKKLNTFK